MKTIKYRAQYTGATEKQRNKFIDDGFYGVEYEFISVQALNINAGFAKALKIANQPLGNGVRRELGAIEFWEVTAF